MQPTIIEDTQSIAANTVVPNVIVVNAALRGLLNAPYPSKISFLAVISAVGLTVDVLHGSDMHISNSAPRIASFIEDPLDLMNDDAYTQAQEQMVVRVTNITAGALLITYRMILTPLVDEATWDGNPVQLPPDTRVMQNLQSIGANAADTQLLDGTSFEQNDMPSILRVLMTASATGLLRQLFIDQDRIAPPSAMSIANRIPQDPFDSTVAGVEVAANKKQFLSVVNTTGGALTVRWKTKNKMLIRT